MLSALYMRLDVYSTSICSPTSQVASYAVANQTGTPSSCFSYGNNQWASLSYPSTYAYIQSNQSFCYSNFSNSGTCQGQPAYVLCLRGGSCVDMSGGKNGSNYYSFYCNGSATVMQSNCLSGCTSCNQINLVPFNSPSCVTGTTNSSSVPVNLCPVGSAATTSPTSVVPTTATPSFLPTTNFPSSVGFTLSPSSLVPTSPPAVACGLGVPSPNSTCGMIKRLPCVTPAACGACYPGYSSSSLDPNSPCIHHCLNGVQDYGEVSIDCGGPDCAGCSIPAGSSGLYNFKYDYKCPIIYHFVASVACGGSYSAQLVLDPVTNFTICWSVDFGNSLIYLGLKAATTGYIGFGISEPTSSTMGGSDMVFFNKNSLAVL